MKAYQVVLLSGLGVIECPTIEIPLTNAIYLDEELAKNKSKRNCG